MALKLEFSGQLKEFFIIEGMENTYQGIISHYNKLHSVLFPGECYQELEYHINDFVSVVCAVKSYKNDKRWTNKIFANKVFISEKVIM